MSRYHISESVGSHVENVQEYSDLEKHHPSAGRQAGRDYATLDGRLEEVRHLSDGRTLIKKDFILSQDAPGPVYVPAPAAGYVHYLHDETNAVRIYDRPFGEPGAKLVAQALHMTPGTSPREGAHVEYGQHLGRMGDTGSPGSVHAHVELEPAAFRRYVHDISSGAITPDHYPQRNAAPSATPGAPAPAPTQPPSRTPTGTTTPASAAAGTTELSNLIGRGEGGYNSYNRGHAGDARTPLAVSDMTVGEIMRRQALPGSDPERLFAVGKFQMVPGTMSETVRALHVDPNARFTPALQERMFADYLIDGKRPAVHAYITGGSQGADGLQRAQVALAQEFASVADPRTGRSYYDGDSAGNHSSITAQQTHTALDHMRAQYQANVQHGMAPDAAYRALSGQGAATREAPTPGHAAPSDRVLREGANGADVGNVQKQLNALGVHDAQGHRLAEDRDFGTHTREAVQAFQRGKGLEPDGVVGRDTFAALRAATQSQAAAPHAQTDAHAPTTAPSRATPTPAEPLLSDAAHPRHALYEQAMTATGRLPAGTFQNDNDRRNASATLAFEASVGGLRKIDEVVPSTNGKGLFAVEGALNDPAHHRVYADKAQAVSQSVEQSTQLMRQDAPAVPQQVTPTQPEQERRPVLIA